MNREKFIWVLRATLGLILVGGGLSLAIDAGFRKFSNQPWVLYGTFALILFNSGLCITIDAALYRFRKQLKKNKGRA